MKNKLFLKAITIVISSFVICLDQTLAIASNNQKITITEGNSESIIAQLSGQGGNTSQTTNQLLVQAISLAQTALGDASATANSEAISGSQKDALVKSIAQASTLIGNAETFASSTAKSNQAAAAISLAEAITVIGEALAIAESDAVSGDGAPAIAQSLASAQAVLGNATASASSSSSSRSD